MKLLNQDFKKAMQGYKAVKTICKSAKMTFCGDETVIQSEDVELSYGHDQDFDKYITVDEPTLKLMEKCKDDFELSLDSVKSNTKTINYHCDDEHEQFIKDIPFTKIAEISQAELLSCIKGVKFATAKDDIRPVLQNILWENGNFVSVDGFRVVTKNTTVSPDMSVLFTPTTYTLLEKLLDKKSDEPVKVFLDLDHTDKQYMAFEFGEVDLITLAGKGDFLDCKSLMNGDYNLSADINRKEFIEKLEFLQQDKAPLVINVTVDKLLLSTRTVSNELMDELNIDLDVNNGSKTDLRIAVNPRYLIESLKNMTDDVVKMTFTTEVAPMTIIHSGGKDLILPVRLKG